MAWLERDAEHGTRAKYHLPDLVLLDIKLPGASGLDVLRWIRDQPALATLPVVMFSGSDLETDVADAYRLGANLYLSKPTGDGMRAVAKFLIGWVELSPSPRAFKQEWQIGSPPVQPGDLRCSA
jgi:CheY-like chemotaxis protein